MIKKALFVIFLSISVFCLFLISSSARDSIERGAYSIYFMDEKVGYEEYTWEEDENGYFLSVKGRMTKPADMEIERLEILLDKNFIAQSFTFKGSVNGVLQEVTSLISEGVVNNTIRVAGQESQRTVKIRRDAFLLPNPVFSPYLVLAKKYRCSLEEGIELSAYIIPQLENTFILSPVEDVPCSLVMQLSGIRIELQTDEEGNLLSLSVPTQRLEVLKTAF
jgi:hypothetical protein